ncbi:MAG: gliding motility-associated C-terminal domain-containing protein [Bacteroidia bacterium]|nr:gliding motility-associated C-terminal domain-containing protein [Bacteroidia bacterium]
MSASSRVWLILGFLVMLSFNTMTAVASHLMGLDITYRCLGNGRIRIFVKVYRDCGGIGFSDPPDVVSDLVLQGIGGGCVMPTPMNPNWVKVVNPREVTPVCAGTVTECNGGSVKGVEEWWYRRDYDFTNANCAKYRVVTGTCCRNSSINTIVSPGGAGLYSPVTIINPNYCNNPPGDPANNSSPQFSTPPIPYICVNQLFTFNQGAVDIDGDSLVYRLGTCFDTQTQPIQYGGGYNPITHPINGTTTINSRTGDITMFSTVQHTAIICVYVDEYRNGTLIGSVMRDIQVTFISCGSNRIPNLTGINGNGQFIDTICAGVPYCINIPSVDSNNSLIKLTATSSIPGGVFTADTGYTASPTATFCWTPNLADARPSLWTLTVEARDNYCPLNGINQYSFSFLVTGGFTPNDTTTAACNVVTFDANPVGTNPAATYTYSWSGPSGLSSNPARNQKTFSHTYPGSGSYRYYLTITDNAGCSVTDSGFAVVAPPPNANAGNDITICPNGSGQLGHPPVPGYTYTWSPATGLSSTAVANPTVSLANPGTSPITRSYILVVFDGNCTFNDTVVVTVNNRKQSTITGDSVVCFGDTAMITANAGLRYLWSTGDSTRTIRVAPSATSSFSVTVTDSAGCVGLPATKSVSVIPKAITNIVGNLSICTGDSTVLTASGGTSYIWQPGGITSASITVSPTANTVYTATASNGTCTGVPQSVTVSVKPLPNATFTTSTAFTGIGDTILITYTGAEDTSIAIPLWNFGNATIVSGSGWGPYIISYPDSGLKTIWLTVNLNACLSSFNSNVGIVAPPIADAGPDLSFCSNRPGVMLQGSAIGSTGCSLVYQWLPTTGLSDPTSPNPIANPSVTTKYYLQVSCGRFVSNMDSVIVYVNAPPTAIVTQSFVNMCFGLGGVALPGGYSGGSGAVSYRWSPANGLSSAFIPNPIANPTVTTDYYLTVTDSFGCSSDSAKVTVNVHQVPVANAGPDQYICSGTGQGVFLQGSVSGGFGSYEYLWLPSAGIDSTSQTPFVRPDTTTIYTLVVKSNFSGCMSDRTTLDTLATVTVHVVPGAIANAGQDTSICEGGSVQIGDLPVGGGPTYAYEWTPTIGLSSSTVMRPFASPAFTTTYFMTVITNGCRSIADSVTVTVNPRPTINAGATVSICPKDSVQLNPTVTVPGIPGASVTYRWVPGYGLSDSTILNPKASPSVTTTYQLFAAYKGCESVGSSILVQVLEAPLVDADTTNSPFGLSMCQYSGFVVLPAKITSSVQPVSFYWTPSTGLSNPNALNPIARPNESTVYTLVATLGSCTVSDTVIVAVIPSIDANITASATTICRGESVTMSTPAGIGGEIFTWSPAEGLNTTIAREVIATPMFPTLYTVVAQIGECADTSTIFIDVQPRPKAKFVNTYDDGCRGLSVSFIDQSIEGENLFWDFGDGTPIVNSRNPIHVFQTAGTYQVTLIAQAIGGCRDTFKSESLVIIGQDLDAYFVSTPELPFEAYLPGINIAFRDSTHGSVHWLWNFGDGLKAEGREVAHTYEYPGEYMVTLYTMSIEGCTDTITRGPYIVKAPEFTIPNVFTPNGDGINDVFYVSYEGKESFEMLIFDRWGNRMYTTTTSGKAGGWYGNINTGSQKAPEGTYYYVVKIGDKVYKESLTLLR